MTKVKKLTTVLLAMAMMIVLAQSAFASNPYYTNPNGTIATAAPVNYDLGAYNSGQLLAPNETDYYKLPRKNKFIEITLQSPGCVPDNSPWHNPVCVDYDVSVFKIVNGAQVSVSTFIFEEGGISGKDVIQVRVHTDGDHYIKVFGHPPKPIGTDPFGNPIINYYFSNASYKLTAKVV